MGRAFAAFLVVVALYVAAASPRAASATEADSHTLIQGISAQEEGHGDEGAESTTERRDGLNSTVIWSIAGLGIVAAVLGVFYFFKRQVGGFPENPAWVAPITIMPSREFPDEGDYGDAVPGAHGQVGH